jgi:hypothetical protein
MSLNNLDAIKLRMSLEDTRVADEWVAEVASLQLQRAVRILKERV